MPGIGGEKVVEVACHRGHRLIAGGYAEPGRSREVAGQDRPLNVARDLELTLDLPKSLLALEGASRRHVPEAAEKHCESVGLDVEMQQVHAYGIVPDRENDKDEQ